MSSLKNRLNQEVRMKARYVGRCTVCDCPIDVGEEIVYSPISGPRHADVDGCHDAQDHTRQLDGVWEGEEF